MGLLITYLLTYFESRIFFVEIKKKQEKTWEKSKWSKKRSVFRKKKWWKLKWRTKWYGKKEGREGRKKLKTDGLAFIKRGDVRLTWTERKLYDTIFAGDYVELTANQDTW